MNKNFVSGRAARIRFESSSPVSPFTKKAASAAKVAHVSTHSMRHTYRSWLDSVGTALTVQQKLMRHADIRTTMNTYGEVVTDEMSRAAFKVAGLALNGAQAERSLS
jgi:integrase